MKKRPKYWFGVGAILLGYVGLAAEWHFNPPNGWLILVALGLIVKNESRLDALEEEK